MDFLSIPTQDSQSQTELNTSEERKRRGIQLAYPFSESRLLNKGRLHSVWTPPYILQPKLNGERCRAIVSESNCLLLSSTEEIIQAVPHINSYCIKHLPPGEYDGELYVHGLTWAEIHGIVSRTTTLHDDYGRMQLHLFDIVDETIPQLERSVRLQEITQGLTHPIQRVSVNIANTLEEVYSLYDRYISKGYEGFIIREINSQYIRQRSYHMMKFKPKATDHYRILNIYEAISKDSKPKGILGGFTCVDDMGSRFKVGAGKLPHSERKRIWENYLDQPDHYIGRLLEIEYQTLSDKEKVPLFSRAVKILPSTRR